MENPLNKLEKSLENTFKKSKIDDEEYMDAFSKSFNSTVNYLLVSPYKMPGLFMKDKKDIKEKSSYSEKCGKFLGTFSAGVPSLTLFALEVFVYSAFPELLVFPLITNVKSLFNEVEKKNKL